MCSRMPTTPVSTQHPLFEQFGAPLPREEACASLGLDPQLRYALFFGLIRDYKGKRECLEREIKIFYPSLFAFLPPNGIDTPTNPLTELEFFPKNM